MKYEEAITNLDMPSEGEDYGKVMMKSKSRDKWVLRSKYGLVYCTRDWPAPFSPTKEDMSAEDWEIER